MAKDLLFTKEDYDQNFSALSYREIYYSTQFGDTSSGEEDHGSVYSKVLHKAFSDGTIKGDTLLDYGCGPCVHGPLIASKFVKEITMAEFCDRNRDAVKAWLNKAPDAIDWDDAVAFVIGLDGESDGEARRQLLKSKLKKLVPCDANQPNPIAPEHGPFDIVITSLMVEVSGAPSFDTYKRNMKHAASLIKPGGFFVQHACHKCSYWQVGDQFYKCYPLTEAKMKEALTEAGLTILRQNFVHYEPIENICDWNGAFQFVCKKEL